MTRRPPGLPCHSSGLQWLSEGLKMGWILILSSNERPQGAGQAARAPQRRKMGRRGGGAPAGRPQGREGVRPPPLNTGTPSPAGHSLPLQTGSPARPHGEVALSRGPQSSLPVTGGTGLPAIRFVLLRTGWENQLRRLQPVCGEHLWKEL